MPVILDVHFAHNGPWGNDLLDAMKGLAESITHEPGLHWKVWTEDMAQKLAGGIYLFDSRQHAQQYLEMHSARLAGFGVTHIHARIFEVNQPLSRINNAPLPA